MDAPLLFLALGPLVAATGAHLFGRGAPLPDAPQHGTTAARTPDPAPVPAPGPVEDTGAHYLLEPTDIPATLARFQPGIDTVTLQLDSAETALGEAKLDGEGCALVDGERVLIHFPRLDRLPMADIFLSISDDTVVGIGEMPLPARAGPDPKVG